MAWIDDIVHIIALGLAAGGCWAVVTRRVNRALVLKGCWYLAAFNIGMAILDFPQSDSQDIAFELFLSVNFAVLLVFVVFILKHLVVESWIVLQTIYLWSISR